MKPDAFEPLRGHETDLEAHINDMVRKDGVASHEGYMNHISNKYGKEIDKLKTDAGKDKKRQALAAKLEHIQSNKDSFTKALELHQHLQKAKNVLTDVMSQNTDI